MQKIIFIISLFGQVAVYAGEIEDWIHRTWGADVAVTQRRFQPADSTRKRIDQSIRSVSTQPGFEVWRVSHADSVLGFAVQEQIRGRSALINYAALLNNEGALLKMIILEYKGVHGRGVMKEEWLDQFMGKSITNALTPGQDLDLVSGATISAANLARSVRRMLMFFPMMKNNF